MLRRQDHLDIGFWTTWTLVITCSFCRFTWTWVSGSLQHLQHWTLWRDGHPSHLYGFYGLTLRGGGDMGTWGHGSMGAWSETRDWGDKGKTQTGKPTGLLFSFWTWGNSIWNSQCTEQSHAFSICDAVFKPRLSYTADSKASSRCLCMGGRTVSSVDPVSKSSRTLWAPPPPALLSISEHVQHCQQQQQVPWTLS